MSSSSIAAIFLLAVTWPQPRARQPRMQVSYYDAG
jgi:hypothetical protein